jgi:hypothetical protein
LIAANLWDKNPPPGKARSFGGTPNANTLIYWGGAEGFSASRQTVLPSIGNEDVATADLNDDGWLDLILSSYHAGTTRSHPSYVDWNSPTGFDRERVTMLPTNSASGILVCDFNRDGRKDILFACHSFEGNHRNDSFLYWGTPEGFSPKHRTLIPAKGPHFMTVSDVGNIYDRTARYAYISPPFKIGSGSTLKSIEWEAETPFSSWR